jgi:hypothetical protein
MKLVCSVWCIYRLCPKSNVSDFIVKWIKVAARSDRLESVGGGSQLMIASLLCRLRTFWELRKAFPLNTFLSPVQAAMQRSKKQRITINFFVKRGVSAVEIFSHDKYGLRWWLSERQIYRWHKAFLEGREGVGDEAPPTKEWRVWENFWTQTVVWVFI